MRGDCSTDRRRENHRHSLQLAFVPGADQPLGILKHLRIGCAACRGFLLGNLSAPIFHLSTVEAHGRIVAEPAYKSIDGKIVDC